jgi:transposase
MKAMHRRCAGLDVHQQEIVACRRIVAGRKVRTEVGRFSTTTQGLLELADWLEDGNVTHVAMEATGVYWSPSGTFFMAGSLWFWPMRRTFATCRAARVT